MRFSLFSKFLNSLGFSRITWKNGSSVYLPLSSDHISTSSHRVVGCWFKHISTIFSCFTTIILCGNSSSFHSFGCWGTKLETMSLVAMAFSVKQQTWVPWCVAIWDFKLASMDSLTIEKVRSVVSSSKTSCCVNLAHDHIVPGESLIYICDKTSATMFWLSVIYCMPLQSRKYLFFQATWPNAQISFSDSISESILYDLSTIWT